MKKYFYTTLFTLIFPVLVIGAYFAVLPAQSVNAQGTCAISQVGFRTYKAGGNFSAGNFYQSSDRPIVYFDIATSGCIGQAIKVSLVGELFDINDNVNAIDDRIISVGGNTNNEPNFTIVGRAGEEGCSITMSPECTYNLVIKNSSGVQIFDSTPSTLDYSCEGVCDYAGETWEYLDLIPYHNDLGGGGLDQYGPGVTAGNVTTTPPPSASDTPGGPSIIDLSIPNPLAGTVGTIPEFFHMAVDFVITIGIPLVAMAIVYSGFLFVTARGSDEQLSHAKEALTYAIIGGLVLLAAWLVAGAIKDALLSI